MPALARRCLLGHGVGERLSVNGSVAQDHEAWKEMADMYLEQQQLDHARKALEEVVMLQVAILLPLLLLLLRLCLFLLLRLRLRLILLLRRLLLLRLLLPRLRLLPLLLLPLLLLLLPFLRLLLRLLLLPKQYSALAIQQVSAKHRKHGHLQNRPRGWWW